MTALIQGLARIVGPDCHGLVEPVLEQEAVFDSDSFLVENDDVWRIPNVKRRKVVRSFENLKFRDESILGTLRSIVTAAPASLYKDKFLSALRLSNQHESIVEVLRLSSSREYLSDEQLLTDTRHFAIVHQMHSLLKKFPFQQGFERQAGLAAIASFWESEEFNRATNERWRSEDPSGFLETLSDRLASFLGDCPSMDEVISKGNWGPGSNCGYPLGSDLTSVEFKTAVRPTVQEHNVPLLPRILRQYPLWERSLAERFAPNLTREGCCEIVVASKQSHALKSSLTHRTISMEPLIEGFLQAGVAHFLRLCFKRESRDLDFAWTTCQKLATLGSITDLWCTVDLKAASDSVCRLPLMTLCSGHKNLQQWFQLWDRLRCARGEVFTLPDQPDSSEKFPTCTHTFELFSSMGNSYTFELESALFYCVVTSLVPGIWVRDGKRSVLRWPHVSVFGDDLVFPSAYAPQVFATLEWLGFRINRSKSYVSGPFRESCGMDLLRGVNVRPMFITKEISDGSCIVDLANRIWARRYQAGSYHCCTDDSDPFWTSAHNYVLSKIPGEIRKLVSTPPFVPEGLWEAPMSTPFLFSTPTGRVRRWRVIRRKPKSVDLPSSSLWGADIWPVPLNLSNTLLARLRNMDTPSSRWDETPRGAGDRAYIRRAFSFFVGSSSLPGWGPS